VEEISLKEILFLLNKHKKLIIMITIIATLLGLAFSLLKSYEYEAYATLLLQRPKSENNEIVTDSQELQIEQRFIATCIDILRSRSMFDEVSRNLELDMEYKDYQKNISIDQASSAPIIGITVKNEDPKLAASIANELATLFINNAGRYVEIESVSLIDKAIVPKDPVEKNTILNISIGAILGLMIGVFLSFAIEYLNDTIKTPMDVKNYLSLPVISTIPTDSTPIDLDKGNYKTFESFRIMKANIKYNKNRDIRSYVITSSTAKEGKSYIADNLAKAFANSGERVVLVDFNFKNPSITKKYNLEEKQGLIDLLQSKIKIEELLFSNNISDNLYLVPSGKTDNIKSIELLNTNTILNIKEVLEENFDKIIIETPASSTAADGVELAAIFDATIVVVGVNETKVELAKHTVELLNNVKANIIGVALNKIPLEEEKYLGYSHLYIKDYNEM
jgi:capsular exopolysaccharide synthesis family protein